MRVSSDQLDPGYANYLAQGRVRIWIDGAERNNVITADEEQRTALCLVLDHRGRPMVDEVTRQCKREWVMGSIRIECTPAVPAQAIPGPSD